MSKFFDIPDKVLDTQAQTSRRPPKGGVVINTISSDFLSGDNASFDFDAKRKLFLAHMEMLRAQSVQEHTLYKKWVEVTTKYNSTADIIKAAEVEALIWAPTDLMDLEQTIGEITALDPEVVIVPESGPLFEDWKFLRVFVSSFAFTANPGRLMRILIRDRNTNKYLGVCSISSDVAAVRVRDEWIGWTKDNRFIDGKLNNTAIGTTIVPTQPFGFNFLGGKLVASLLCTQVVRDAWEAKFGNVLAGITTTSLYGGHSMYQRIPYWKELGNTAGKINLKPDDSVYIDWLNWIKVYKSEEYERASMPKVGTITSNEDGLHWVESEYETAKAENLLSARNRKELINKLEQQQYSVHANGDVYDPKSRHSYPPTGPKQQCLYVIFRALGISTSEYEHGYQRGVYFSPLYENTREFLRGEITKEELVPIKKLEHDVESVMTWWKEKAIRRYTNLHKDNRLMPEVLFYRKMVQMTWPDVVEKYFTEVGR